MLSTRFCLFEDPRSSLTVLNGAECIGRKEVELPRFIFSCLFVLSFS